MAPNPTEEKHGLFRLYPTPYLADKCVADVVALHGLGGHAFNTWTDVDGHLWLRDSLPPKIPKTRILTFGYDSAVLFSPSRMTINDFALDLLERLRLIRKLPGEQLRPLIFICHSLGGVLFKETLIQASLDTTNHGRIAQSIKGVVFLGTPHRGSKSASQAQILSKIINTATLGSGVRSDLLKTLQVSSPELEAISRHATQLLKKISIVSFYERKPLGFSLIVESFSAILGLPNERAIPINADHRKIARISPRKIERYLPILAAVEELVEETQSEASAPPMSQDYQDLEDLAQKLFCADYTSSQLRARQAHKGTCNWVFENPTYLSWARSAESGILMLSGGPGTGKSVMTRFLLESILSGSEETRIAGIYQGVSFFCSHLNSELINEAESTLLRSLLHQLIQLSPRCEAVVKNRLLSRTSRGLFYSLSRELLWLALREVLSLDFMKFTFIAIDGLEELGTNPAVMLLSGLYDIVHALNQSHPNTCRLRIFLSSRHNPSYSSTIPSLRILRIPHQHVTRGIEIFLQDSVEQLAASKPGFNASADSELRQEIVYSISRKSNGMFLWANMVWDDFRRVMLWSTATIRQKLASINTTPSNITALYDKLIEQIDPAIKEEVFLILSIISVAGRPLRTDEIAVVLSVSRTDHPIHRSSDLDLIQGLDSVIQDNFPDLVTFHDDHTVTLAHPSFDEYLQALWADNAAETTIKAERMITRACLKYLKLTDMIDDASSGRLDRADLEMKYPFLAYAGTYLKHHLWRRPADDSLWLLYADLAGASGPFGRGLLGTNKHTHIFGSRASGEYPPFSPLYEIIDGMPTISSIEALIRTFAGHGYDLDETWQAPLDRGAPLSHCCWELRWGGQYRHIDWKGLCLLLLRLGAHPDPAPGKAKSNLEFIIQGGVWDVFDVMVRNQALDLTQQDARGRYVLHFLVQHGAESTLRKFLNEHDTDVNIQDVTGTTPLHLAAAIGNTTVVRILLNVYGIRLDLTDSSGRTPLTVATYWGQQKVTLCFLEHSQAFPTPEKGQMSALCFAAKHGQIVMCRKLLEACRYKHLELHLDESGRGICHHAAINNWSHILRICLSADGGRALANQIDHSGGTPLHAAARLGNTDSCQVLTAFGANLQLQDRLGRTAAQVAADAGFADSLTVLLQSGRVDPNQRDHQGRNLVHWAASLDSPAVMRRVLDISGVTVEIARRDNYGAMPIVIADRCKSANVGKLLALEMERRGLNPVWYAGYAWDMMYRSPEVEIDEEEASRAGPLGLDSLQSRHDSRQWSNQAEWERLHQAYPEEKWGLTTATSSAGETRDQE